MRHREWDRSFRESRTRPTSSVDWPTHVGAAGHSAAHGRDILVAHLLERERRERRAVSPCTYEDDFFRAVQHSLDFALQVSSGQMYRPRDVAEVPFIRLTHVEVNSGLFFLEHCL